MSDASIIQPFLFKNKQRRPFVDTYYSGSVPRSRLVNLVIDVSLGIILTLLESSKKYQFEERREMVVVGTRSTKMVEMTSLLTKRK